MPQTKLPPITTRQTDILLLLYRFRFLNRTQIQTLLNHKNHQLIIHWLNQLTQLQYITRYYEKTIASKPAIYSLANASRSYLKNHSEIQSAAQLAYIGKELQRTSIFRDHCVFVASTYLSLIDLTEQTKAKLHFSTKIDLRGMKHLMNPLPDAYIAIEEINGSTKRYFLDVFDSGSFKLMRRRVDQYLDYYSSNEWQDNANKPFPEIILVCPNKRAEKYLAYVIHRQLETEPDLQFYLTTKAKIRSNGLTKDTLQKLSPVE